MKLNRKKVTLLSREEMQNLLGGNTPQKGGMGSSDCNNICTSNDDCETKCKSCQEISNWGPLRSCVHGNPGSDTGSDDEFDFA